MFCFSTQLLNLLYRMKIHYTSHLLQKCFLKQSQHAIKFTLLIYTIKYLKNIFTELYNHDCSLDRDILGHIYHCRKKCHIHFPFLSLSPAWVQKESPFLSLWFCPFWTFHIKGIPSSRRGCCDRPLLSLLVMCTALHMLLAFGDPKACVRALQRPLWTPHSCFPFQGFCPSLISHWDSCGGWLWC